MSKTLKKDKRKNRRIEPVKDTEPPGFFLFIRLFQILPKTDNINYISFKKKPEIYDIKIKREKMLRAKFPFSS